jgi:hypothetical protein
MAEGREAKRQRERGEERAGRERRRGRWGRPRQDDRARLAGPPVFKDLRHDV